MRLPSFSFLWIKLFGEFLHRNLKLVYHQLNCVIDCEAFCLIDKPIVQVISKNQIILFILVNIRGINCSYFVRYCPIRQSLLLRFCSLQLNYLETCTSKINNSAIWIFQKTRFYVHSTVRVPNIRTPGSSTMRWKLACSV